jgi:hypothetical protein
MFILKNKSIFEEIKFDLVFSYYEFTILKLIQFSFN